MHDSCYRVHELLSQPLPAIFIEQCSLADFLLRGEIEADSQ